MEKREYWAWISTVKNMYYNKISRLIECFGSIENVYMASATKLENKGKMKKEDVDRITEKIKDDGYEVISGPRTTGDGYYESCILDPEGNQIEITVDRNN